MNEFMNNFLFNCVTSLDWQW